MDHLVCYYGVKFDKCTLEDRIINQFLGQVLCIAKFCLKFHNGSKCHSQNFGIEGKALKLRFRELTYMKEAMHDLVQLDL